MLLLDVRRAGSCCSVRRDRAWVALLQDWPDSVCKVRGNQRGSSPVLSTSVFKNVSSCLSSPVVLLPHKHHTQVTTDGTPQVPRAGGRIDTAVAVLKGTLFAAEAIAVPAIVYIAISTVKSALLGPLVAIPVSAPPPSESHVTLLTLLATPPQRLCGAIAHSALRAAFVGRGVRNCVRRIRRVRERMPACSGSSDTRAGGAGSGGAGGC